MKIYGLIGKKLSHSFSKEYFNKKFSENQVDTAYELFELDDIEQLPKLVSSYPELAGLNVTIPYKQQAVTYCSKLDKTARMTGAVNTLVINRKNDTIELIGYNTDVTGFDQLIKPVLKQILNSRAIILGTGGASKAVQYSLRSHGIGFTIVSRKASKMNQINYAMITPSFIRNHHLIINTTPLGMFPDVDSCPPIPYQYLNENHILIDLIYNPDETAFMKAGKKQQAITFNGLPMLIAQADASWKIWTGNK
ncbi:MAG: shikimate dehydrogenase [Bacteroidales bacterium]|jgi:shikimate dehydrogenase|nr:shikimate dehydrogenase [Bacteroidales bacterium]HOI33479.1 shikimate dehydrogenase [Bacteroidales bacterium]